VEIKIKNNLYKEKCKGVTKERGERKVNKE
jgi:hypothetical protein